MSAGVRTLRGAIAPAALALLGACAAVPEGIGPVASSWERAQAYVPGLVPIVTPDRIALDRPASVVVYVHGCTGIGADGPRWGEFFKSIGVVMVAPDSFARSGRISNCDPRTNTVGYFPQVQSLRAEELRHAVEQVRAARWADPDGVFVLGHSEGGVTAIRQVVPGVRGTIMSGWYCSIAGIPHAPGHPLLLLEWEDDPWNRRATTCASWIGGRSATTYLRLPGRGHSTSVSAAAREAARAFVLGPPPAR